MPTQTLAFRFRNEIQEGMLRWTNEMTARAGPCQQMHMCMGMQLDRATLKAHSPCTINRTYLVMSPVVMSFLSSCSTATAADLKMPPPPIMA